MVTEQLAECNNDALKGNIAVTKHEEKTMTFQTDDISVPSLPRHKGQNTEETIQITTPK